MLECILPPLRGWLPTTACQQTAAWLVLTCTLDGTWPTRDVCQAIAVVQRPGLASFAVRHCWLCCATGWLLGGRKSVEKMLPFWPSRVGHRASTARVLQCRWPAMRSLSVPATGVGILNRLANAGQRWPIDEWLNGWLFWLFGFVLATALATLRRAHRSLDHSTVAHFFSPYRDGVCVMVSSAGCALDCRWQKTIRSILR
jgi:hypothetical protein